MIAIICNLLFLALFLLPLGGEPLLLVLLNVEWQPAIENHVLQWYPSGFL